MSERIEELLDLSKGGHSERPLLPVAMAEIIYAIITDLSSELIEKQVRVEMRAFHKLICVILRYRNYLKLDRKCYYFTR